MKFIIIIQFTGNAVDLPWVQSRELHTLVVDTACSKMWFSPSCFAIAVNCTVSLELLSTCRLL